MVRTAEWKWQRKTSPPNLFPNLAHPGEASQMEKQSPKSHLVPGLQGKLPGRPPSHLISQGALANGNLRKTLQKQNQTVLSKKKKKTRRKRDVKLHPETQLPDCSLQKNRKEEEKDQEEKRRKVTSRDSVAGLLPTEEPERRRKRPGGKET